MTSKFESFAALHVPGDPVILYNIWDVGSALAVAKAGAKALATGSHPVGDAAGFGDGQKVPLDYVFANAKRIVEAVDLPLTVDFEGAYSADALLASCIDLCLQDPALPDSDRPASTRRPTPIRRSGCNRT